jgi:hypothetical protein
MVSDGYEKIDRPRRENLEAIVLATKISAGVAGL